MITSYEELLLKIRSGEIREHRVANVELKEDWRIEYGEDLSALANKTTIPEAWLVVGVTNVGAIKGHDEKWAESKERIISDHINQRLDPSQACKGVRCHRFDGGWVIAINIANPGTVVRWGPDAYKAAGTTSTEMTAEEVAELAIKLPGLTDYTRQAFIGPLDGSLTEAFLANVGQKHPQAVGSPASGPLAHLTTLRIDDKNVSRILFGDCTYRIVKYGSDGNPESHEQQTGLYRVLTPEFATGLQSWTQGRLGGGGDVPYPPLALKEALANAVAHAAYFERDGDIIIEAYPDRLVISNLCAAESRYFANRWFSRSRRTLNVLLMEMLRLAGKVDELGLGKNRIFRESILAGKRPPQVTLEPAGVYSRWKLTLYGGTQDEVQLRLLARLREHYQDAGKALMANALVLWRNEPVSKIREYVDAEFLPIFAELLNDRDGPTFYYEKADRIVLHRWASVLLREGTDSKKLSEPEEQQLLKFAREVSNEFREGYLTSRELRGLAHMGETRSERTVCSDLLRSWVKKGHLQKIRNGVYRFRGPEAAQFELPVTEKLQLIIDALKKE